MEYSEEIKFFGRTFYAILAVLIAIILWLQISATIPAAPVIILAVILPLLFGRLLITVQDNSLHVAFGYLGIIKKDIPLADIKEARVVEYRPIRQFGGWGIRCGKFENKKTGCYTMKGTRGVLLTLSREVRTCISKTNRLIIGSASPERLKIALGK